jgi:hypothetical protein
MSRPFKHVSARKERSRNVSQLKQVDHPTENDPNMGYHTIGVVERSPPHQRFAGIVVRFSRSNERWQLYSFQTACHYCKNWNLIFVHPELSRSRVPHSFVFFENERVKASAHAEANPRMTRPWNPTLRKTKGGAPGRSFAPLGLAGFLLGPTAYAVGYILLPRRGGKAEIFSRRKRGGPSFSHAARGNLLFGATYAGLRARSSTVAHR